MSAYPWIYWLVVAIVAGVVLTVLMGGAYLRGRRAALREATDELHRLNSSLDRVRSVRSAMMHQGGAR